MEERKSVFDTLNSVDVREKTKKKNNLDYLSWASAWAEVKKKYGDATFTIYEMVIDDRGNTRPWFDDGRTGWVKTGVTIGGIELIEELPIMDFRNSAIPAEKITSTDANKSIQRSLTKACARHGLGLYLYEGEDMPEEEKQKKVKEKTELQKKNAECFALAKELSATEKVKVAEMCRKYAPNGNPNRIEKMEDTEALMNELNKLKETK